MTEDSDNVDDLAAIYDEHAKQFDETDFWRQVRRTEGGEPVGDDQIALIVDEMLDALTLQPHDQLLDICCGNGALSVEFFDRCAGGLGVDYSETMIGVARKHFARDTVRYEQGEAVAFLETHPETAPFTKGLIYGSFNFFAPAQAEEMLAAIRSRFTGIERLVIGNIADRAHLDDFFGDRYMPGVEDQPESPIGVWWARDDFAALGERTGWTIEFRRMPESFYASHYRFDAVLTPSPIPS